MVFKLRNIWPISGVIKGGMQRLLIIILNKKLHIAINITSIIEKNFN